MRNALLAPQTSPQIALRDYQLSMLSETYSLIRQGYRSILEIIVMGGGKTVLSTWLMRDAVGRGRKCLFLVTLNVLLEQTARTLQKLGVDCTILQGDRLVDESAPVIVASLQTIGARLRRGMDLGTLLGCIDVIVVDEAHVTAFHDTYSKIDEFFPNAIKIGLTATPYRLSNKEWLGQKFDMAVEGPQPPEIIKLGGAVPCRGYTLTGALDVETLRVRNGEYIDSDIAAQACRDEALDHVVDEYERLCPGRPALMVGATIEQAFATCDRFNQRGIKAEVIVGSTPQSVREAIIDRVKTEETKVICSVGCLTAGFDCPPISAILYVRATKSKALFQQTAGRGSRPYAGKTNYLLLDFGGNLKRFGNPMGFQNYDISQPQQDDPPSMTKTCPDCAAEVTMFARICPECGHEFTGEQVEDEAKQEELILAQLNEYVDSETRQKIKLIRKWRKSHYLADVAPDQAIDLFVQEFGHHPPGEWMHHACLGKNYSQQRKAEFVTYLFRHCNQESKWSKQWVAHHMTIEFGEFNPTIVNWWEVLGVDRNASWEAVKQAYIAKSEELNPDKVIGNQYQELLDQLNLAFSDAKEEVA